MVPSEQITRSAASFLCCSTSIPHAEDVAGELRLFGCFQHSGISRCRGGTTIIASGNGDQPTGSRVRPCGNGVRETGKPVHLTGNGVRPCGNAVRGCGNRVRATGNDGSRTGKSCILTGNACQTGGSRVRPCGKSVQRPGTGEKRPGTPFRDREPRPLAGKGVNLAGNSVGRSKKPDLTQRRKAAMGAEEISRDNVPGGWEGENQFDLPKTLPR